MHRIVIIGASGYSGAELATILLDHPSAEIVGVFGSAKRDTGDAAPQRFSDVWPRFRNRLDLPIRATDINEIAALKPDAVFLATPHEASVALAPQLATGWLQLGNALSRLQRSVEAEAALREALRIQPRHPDALISLGTTLAAQNRLREACAAAEAALRIDPGLSRAHVNWPSV